MNELTLNAYAKINLSLDVTGKRPDGYHEVSMVLQMIDLHDVITVAVTHLGAGADANSQIIVTTNRAYLPTDNRNIAYKAAALMLQEAESRKSGSPATEKIFDKNIRIAIRIEKNIPVAAGLAGGSTDAAAVLLALNQLLEQGLSTEDLMVLGKSLGADVPFCILGNAAMLKIDEDNATVGTCAIATGIGEKLSIIRDSQEKPLSIFDTIWIVLSKPSISVSTPKVYGALNLEEIKERPDNDRLVEGLRTNNLNLIVENMINVLEIVTLKEYCSVMYTKNMLQKSSPIATLMSGSGPSVFGLFADQASAQRACEAMSKVNKETFLVRTI